MSRHHPYLDVFSRSSSSLPPGKPAIALSALGIWEACLALWPEASQARTREAGAARWGGVFRKLAKFKIIRIFVAGEDMKIEQSYITSDGRK